MLNYRLTEKWLSVTGSVDQHVLVSALLCSWSSNNENICIARLEIRNSSGALLAQTNTVSVFVQMSAVTAIGRLFQMFAPCSDCEVPSAECCSSPSDSEAAGLSRSQLSSARHRRDRHTVGSQVWWRQSVQAIVDHHRQFVDNALANRKPVKLAQDWRDVVDYYGVLAASSPASPQIIDLLCHETVADLSLLRPQLRRFPSVECQWPFDRSVTSADDMTAPSLTAHATSAAQQSDISHLFVSFFF